MILTDLITDITTALERMPGLTTALESLSARAIGLFCVLILVALIYKFSGGFYDFFEKRTQTRRETLDQYAGLPAGTDPDVLETVRNERNTQVFKIATGIHAESSKRRALIELHRNISSTESWKDIQRSMPYFVFELSSPIKVKPEGFFDKLGFLYFNFLSTVCLLIAAASTFATFAIATKNPFQIFLPGGIALLFFCVGGLVFSANFPIIASRRIRKSIADIPIAVPTTQDVKSTAPSLGHNSSQQ